MMICMARHSGGASLASLSRPQHAAVVCSCADRGMYRLPACLHYEFRVHYPTAGGSESPLRDSWIALARLASLFASAQHAQQGHKMGLGACYYPATVGRISHQWLGSTCGGGIRSLHTPWGQAWSETGRPHREVDGCGWTHCDVDSRWKGQKKAKTASRVSDCFAKLDGKQGSASRLQGTAQGYMIKDCPQKVDQEGIPRCLRSILIVGIAFLLLKQGRSHTI